MTNKIKKKNVFILSLVEKKNNIVACGEYMHACVHANLLINKMNKKKNKLSMVQRTDLINCSLIHQILSEITKLKSEAVNVQCRITSN